MTEYRFYSQSHKGGVVSDYGYPIEANSHEEAMQKRIDEGVADSSTDYLVIDISPGGIAKSFRTERITKVDFLEKEIF